MESASRVSRRWVALLPAAALLAAITSINAEAQSQPGTTSAASDASAQTPANPSAVTAADTITVFGDAPPKKTEISADVRSLPVDSSLLQGVEIRRKTFREPAELLRSLPGVDVAIYGQGGVPGGISIRGYTDRNFGQDVAGHLDGVPLNMFGWVASHGALDLTLLFPDVVDRIELVRGPLDARYGDFNRGASVNFVTRETIARPSLTIGGGSYGSWRASGLYGSSPDRNRLSFYTTFDGAGTQGYADNQDLTHFKSFHRLHIPFGRSDVAISALTFWSEWDAPSYLDLNLLRAGTVRDTDAVNPTDGGNQNTQLYYVRYRLDANSPDELAVTGYLRHGEWRRFRSDFLISPTQTQTRQIDERVTFGYRVEKRVGHTLFNRPSSFVVGSTLQRDDADTMQASTLNRNVLTLTDDVPEVLTSFGFFAQEQWQPRDRLKLMGGLRYSRVDYDISDRLRAPGAFVSQYADSQVSPKAGVAVEVVRDVEVYANYATGMRSPTPRTEVRNSLQSVGRVEIADTDSAEFGARALIANRVEVHGNVWRADNSNEIRGIPPGGTQFESLGKSRRNGGSLDARYFVTPVTRVFGSLSWLEARLLTPVTPAAFRLPDIPAYAHMIGFESGIPLPGRTAGELVVTADLSFYGKKPLNTLGTLFSEPYERLTFRALYEHRQRYRVWVGGFAYPGSRYGESAFLFGSRVGVRPNPTVSVDAGFTYLF